MPEIQKFSSRKAKHRTGLKTRLKMEALKGKRMKADGTVSSFTASAASFLDDYFARS